MAAVTRKDLNSGVLQTFLLRTTLTIFEPNLYFYAMGKKPEFDGGYNTLEWAKFTQINESSVTAGASDGGDDGVTPADTAFNATVVSVSPVQYRVVVTLSDILIENNVIGFLEGAAKQVGKAMARKVDSVIQTTVMAGTNVMYGGTQTTRSGLGATDVLTATLLNRSGAKLESFDAPKINGYYVCIIHPNQLYDLRKDTNAGSWLDSAKYTTPETIYKGEIGMLYGVRVVVSSHVNTFASNTTVYPALVIGEEAFGVGSWETLQVYATPAVASDSDPLAQRRKVGAKMAFGSVILQQNSMVRVETGATAI